MSELIKINPQEFGLDENRAVEISNAFAPKISERDGLVIIYNDLITKDITQEVCNEALSLKRKLVKVRTGIADIHKTQKAFYLAAGKFVDAWKNKETLPVEQMESKLQEIANYYENLEAQRIAKVAEGRAAELEAYEQTGFADLGIMSDEVWANYIAGVKLNYETKLAEAAKAEAERLEAERLAEEKRKADEIENERVKKELAKLKAEADKKEAERLAELQAIKAKQEQEQRERERLAKIESDKQAKIQADLNAKLEAEKQARLKSENEIKAKKDAEAKAEADKKEAERLAKLAPEKDKINNWISSIELPNIDKTGFSSAGIATVETIEAKFKAFKLWMDSQVINIK